METKIINDIAIVKSNEVIIKDLGSVIDFLMTIKYDTNCDKIALNKEAIVELDEGSLVKLGLKRVVKENFRIEPKIEALNNNK